MDREEPHLSLFGRIRSLKDQHRYSEAEEEIQRELEKKPEQPFLKATLADLFLHQNRLAEPRILIDEILSRDPQHPQALYLLGEIFLKRNSPKEALECFRQAFAREPRDFLVLRSARALKEMNRFAEALEELEKVLVVKPKNFPFDDEPYVRAVLQAGANGYVLKTADAQDIVEAVGSVREGKSVLDPAIARQLISRFSAEPPLLVEELTERELEVLRLAAHGYTNKAIGVQLSISDRTVQGHLAKVFGKLHAASRTEAVMRAVTQGLIPPVLDTDDPT